MDPFALKDDGSAKNPAAYREALAKDPARVKALAAADPALSAALLGDDANAMQAMLRKARSHRACARVPRRLLRARTRGASDATPRLPPRGPHHLPQRSPLPAHPPHPAQVKSDAVAADDRSAAFLLTSLERVRARCTLPRDSASVYEGLAQVGLQYGPAFRLLTDVHVPDRSPAAAALAAAAAAGGSA